MATDYFRHNLHSIGFVFEWHNECIGGNNVKYFLKSSKIVYEPIERDSNKTTTIDYSRKSPYMTAYNPITGRKYIESKKKV